MATTTKKPLAKRPAAQAAKPPVKKGFPPRKPGTASDRPARKPLPTFKAPADFKPHFLLLQVKTEADGLNSGTLRERLFRGCCHVVSLMMTVDV
jgi:hypothetical protein